MPKTNDSERSKKADSAKDVRRKSGTGSGLRAAASKPPASASRSSARLDAARPAARDTVAAVSAVFPPDELRKWRELLLQRRAEIAGDIGSLEKDAMEADDGHATPNHIAERGSDAELQDVSLNIAGDEKALVWQIDRALRKIDQNRPIPFGICEHTRQPIQRNRLQLLPWTPLSIEGATYMESNGLTIEDVLIDD